MRLIFLVLITSIAFFACKNVDIQSNLTGGNYKFWIRENDSNSKSARKTFYYFDENGKWLVFIRYANGSFEKYDGGDVVLIETWKPINKDTINIGEALYRIGKCSKDEILLLSVQNDTLRLIAASLDSIPSEFRKRQ